MATVAGAAALAWGLLMTAVFPPGIALVPVGLGIAAAGAGYLAFAVEIPPTPAGLRRLVMADQG